MAVHGYVIDPPARSCLCSQKQNINCGDDANTCPQCIDGPKGFPHDPTHPRDGYLANADNSGGSYQILNEKTVDRWKLTDIKLGKHTFKWVYTAAHATTKFRYFLTKQGWNPNMVLSRAQYYTTPFCTVDAGTVRSALS